MKNLLTAFGGTSSEKLIREIKEYETLILPNDKILDSKMLIKSIANTDFDYIVSFGQRPNIKNKVHVETVAKEAALQIHTQFDCERMKALFEANGISAKLSANAGTSFCNKLYFEGLSYIRENEMKTQMVFVHVPFEKNIDDLEAFRCGIRSVLRSLHNKDMNV